MKGIVFVILLSLSLVSVIERVVLVHSSRYPAWLAAGKIERLTPGAQAQFRAKFCGDNQPVEVFEKEGQSLVRCGLWWPQSKTWVVPRTPANIAILQDPDTL